MLPIRDASQSFKLSWDYIIPMAGLVENGIEMETDLTALVAMVFCCIALFLIRLRGHGLQGTKSGPAVLVLVEEKLRIILVCLAIYTDVTMMVSLCKGLLSQFTANTTRSPLPTLFRLLTLLPLKSSRFQCLLLYPVVFSNTVWVLEYAQVIHPDRRGVLETMSCYTFFSYAFNVMVLLYTSVTFLLYPLCVLVLTRDRPELQNALYSTQDETILVLACGLALYFTLKTFPTLSFPA